MIKGVPIPDNLSVGSELDEIITDNRLSGARSVRIRLTGIVVFNVTGIRGHRKKITIGHLMGLVMKASRLNRDSPDNLASRSTGGIKRPDNIAAHVHLN